VKFRILVVMLCILTDAGWPGASGESREVSKPQGKIQHIEANARSPHPDPTPTILTEQEVNAYLASDQIQLPAGVQSVKLEGHPGIINGTARVDFDRVREGAHSSNPLLSIFSGVHEVAVATDAHGANGQGYVHVDSVSLDGIQVPNFALQLFVEKYLQPRYPQIGIDSRFNLPDRIDQATVGEHQITIIQK
jgi:hypothetical protein